MCTLMSWYVVCGMAGDNSEWHVVLGLFPPRVTAAVIVLRPVSETSAYSVDESVRRSSCDSSNLMQLCLLHNSHSASL